MNSIFDPNYLRDDWLRGRLSFSVRRWLSFWWDVSDPSWVGEHVPLGVKLIMEEDGLVVREVNLVEVIHVELSDERWETIVAIVPGEDNFF